MARHLLRVRRRHATVPDVVTHGAAIGACDQGQHHQPSLHPLRAAQRHAIVPEAVTFGYAALTGGSACWPHIACVRRSAMPACRLRLPTVPPSAWAERGPQHPRACHPARARQRHTLVREGGTYGAAIFAGEQGKQLQQNLRGRRRHAPCTSASPNGLPSGQQRLLASHLLRAMQSQACVPDEVSHGAAVCACKRGGPQHQQAWHLSCARRRRYAIMLVADTHSAAICACERASSPQQTSQLARATRRHANVLEGFAYIAAVSAGHAGLTPRPCEAAVLRHRVGRGRSQHCHKRGRKGQQHQRSSHLARAMRRHANVPEVFAYIAAVSAGHSATSPSRLVIPYECCSAMPSRRLWSPTALPAARAGKGACSIRGPYLSYVRCCALRPRRGRPPTRPPSAGAKSSRARQRPAIVPLASVAGLEARGAEGTVSDATPVDSGPALRPVEPGQPPDRWGEVGASWWGSAGFLARAVQGRLWGSYRLQGRGS